MIERIDGTDYEVGTGAHAAALGARAERLDAEFVELHPELVAERADQIAATPRLGDRLDANQTVFLARDLVHVRATIERTIYDENVAAQEIPIEGGHPEGATSYVTRRMDERGKARFSTELTGDIPKAEVLEDEDSRKYTNVLASYSFTIQDLVRSAMAGTPLPAMKGQACAQMIARGLDQIGRSGTVLDDASNPIGLTGLFNNALVTVHTMTNGEWDTETDATKIIADLFEIEQTIIAAARDTQTKVPYTLFLPTTMEGHLCSLLVPNTSVSVKNWFLQNGRGLIKSIRRWVKLDDATSPSIAASDAPQGVCVPNDISTLFWPMSVAYHEQPPQLDGFEWTIPAYARVGGVEVRRPYEMLYIQNLD